VAAVDVETIADEDHIIVFANKVTKTPREPDDRIKIYTAQDLNDVRNDLDGSYVLMNDIDLSEFNGGGCILSS
jgi:hypothetical protein